MTKYLKVFWTIIRNAYIRDSKISGFVLVSMITQLFYVVLALVFFSVIFSFTDNLAGWNYYQILFLYGFARSLAEFSKSFYRYGIGSMSNDLIREGTLDFYLTKPIDPMIFVSMSKPRLYTLASWLFSLGIMVYAILVGNISISPMSIIWFLTLAVFGNILYYFLTIIVIIPAFWLQRLWVLTALIGKFSEIMRYPIGMFNNITKVFLGLVFPVMIAAYVPVKSLLFQPDYLQMIYLVIITVVIGFITRALWNLGVRSYSSASS